MKITRTGNLVTIHISNGVTLVVDLDQPEELARLRKQYAGTEVGKVLASL